MAKVTKGKVRKVKLHLELEEDEAAFLVWMGDETRIYHPGRYTKNAQIIAQDIGHALNKAGVCYEEEDTYLNPQKEGYVISLTQTEVDDLIDILRRHNNSGIAGNSVKNLYDRFAEALGE